MEQLTGLRFKRLLLTGAAGTLGRMLRPRMKRYCETLRVSDLAAMDPAGEGEEVVVAPLEDEAAMYALLEGVDAVLHFGGVSIEKPFGTVLPANIVGAYNLYEAARRRGTRRIVFASSNHVTGFYGQGETIPAHVVPRPDSYYGLSKAFGENLAQFYFDRHGLETVSIRIGSCLPEPQDRRHLSSWISHDDMERLLVAALSAPVVGHSIVYGASDNRTTWWDNSQGKHVGYRPQDSSEPWRAAVEAKQPHIDPSRPEARYQGGAFVVLGPFAFAGQPGGEGA
ncbi:MULTISPECIES: NAD(P)-dependent oxidoreductase [Roseateles]|uniref:Uronate dehydrogenase n=1 Tax=Pelomonas aquatica TaxID=431058 RepID=A0ABU1ZB27_9BURK|nr:MULTISPECIES: NAD(P)-dependent oxidoreductase [Roseateles]KQY89420.1 NAD-dependent dehydratase [Pelomonas sp. Root1444]MDR7297832.1 uronate dehydrogenase [Pelomonas aquatica]